MQKSLSEKIAEERENLLYNLTWLRRRESLSKEEMAAVLHISIAGMEQLEKGVLPEELSAEVFLVLQERFGLSPVQLLSERIEKS